jgi:hypothetical protein
VVCVRKSRHDNSQLMTDDCVMNGPVLHLSMVESWCSVRCRKGTGSWLWRTPSSVVLSFRLRGEYYVFNLRNHKFYQIDFSLYLLSFFAHVLWFWHMFHCFWLVLSLGEKLAKLFLAEQKIYGLSWYNGQTVENSANLMKKTIYIDRMYVIYVARKS